MADTTISRSCRHRARSCRHVGRSAARRDLGLLLHCPCLSVFLGLALAIGSAQAHIIPPEKLHPVAEAYRRGNFILNLNPIVWKQLESDVEAIAKYWQDIDAKKADTFLAEARQIIALATLDADEEKGIEPLPRREAASRVFELMTRAVAALVRHHMEAAEKEIEDRPAAMQQLRQAQGVWAAFEVAVRATDPQGHRRQGRAWLRMASAVGSPGLLGHGAIAVDRDGFRQAREEVLTYTETNFGADFVAVAERKLAPWPVNSDTFDPQARLPIRLPPGNNINKQIPRPRQILGMAARGVDESETALIALGDMAFDSAYLFGEPARSLGISCNTCHNKGITNPNFIIPGLSARPGTLDTSNSFFAPHANNGHFDPLDIPDLRGIRFTAPYGRNGRFASLREFVRNVIVNEFNGEEPDATLMDGIIAYMNEFEFLPNPALNNDGTLKAKASQGARRGEKIFNRSFKQMGGKSCATCHIPSSHFVDHRRHDIGTVRGHEQDSLDRSLDTPTLLSAKYTPPYFHDGSQPTLRAVNEWFNNTYKLRLTNKELDDLTAYVETVGDGIEAYEDTVYYLDAEMEEFGFFLSAYEFMEQKNKPKLMNMTFATIELEIRNHKWELQDASAMPVMDRLGEIIGEAYEANLAGDRDKVRARVQAYRKLYAENVEILK